MEFGRSRRGSMEGRGGGYGAGMYSEGEGGRYTETKKEAEKNGGEGSD